MFGFRKPADTEASAAVGVEIRGDGFAVSALSQRGDKPHLHWCEWVDAGQFGPSSERLESLVDRRGIDGLKATVVLPASDYQLHRIPKPAVPAAELRQALRWQLRELVDFPLAEAVIDAFPVSPNIEVDESGNAKAAEAEVFVVVARQQRLETHINVLREAGLEIDAIEIPELAMARLHGQLDKRLHELDATASVASALLHLVEGEGLLAVCRQQVLLMARELQPETELATPTTFDLAFDSSQSVAQPPSQSAARIASALQFFDEGASAAKHTLWHLPTVSANDWWPELVAGGSGSSNRFSNISLQSFELSQLMTGAESTEASLQARCLLSTAAALRSQYGLQSSQEAV